jgi:hypothetical protein
MIAQSIPELTGYEYNELYYNSAGALITGSFIFQVCDLINQCGINVAPTNTYNYSVCNAVMEFQEMVGMTGTGILTTNTLQAMILYAQKILNDTVTDDTETEDDSETIKETSPHYNSFFDDDNLKMHRRNHKDIKIVFGNKSITKTIKDVFMRSVSVEVDTSGNPISEVYEFIARDIIESDELTDINKYDEEYSTSSDVSYDFSFIKSNK